MAAAPTPDGRGFWVAYSNGGVAAKGDARWYGDVSHVALNRPIVGIEGTADGHGYWLLGGDGGVFGFGDAHFYGSTGRIRLNSPALQMAVTPAGRGYDFVAGDGGIFTFGNGRFFGSTGDIRLARPVVGMSMNKGGNGYWLVASDGGIFTFGNARFHGSTGAVHLNAPIVGMARTASGNGYWLVAADGGIFTFGDARFHGSGAGRTAGARAVGVVATRDGGGYWIVLSDGRVLNEGDAFAIANPARHASAPPPDNHYTFESTNSAGQPIRWNPCETITYAVVPAGAPAGWQSDVNNVISQVSAATGLHLASAGVYGSTAQVPGSVKITISWSNSLAGGDLEGYTTYWYFNVSGYTPEIVSAKIQVLSGLRAGGGSGELPVLLHEMGHALGLGHTLNPEVMNPVDQGYSSYQLGDRNGLWQLGTLRGCSGFYQ